MERADEDMIVLLMRKGAWLDKTRRFHPLIYAVKNSREDLIRLLIGNGFDPNLANAAGDRPLHVAAAYTNLPMVRLLLALGADAKATNRMGRRPAEVIGKGVARIKILELLKKP